MGQNMEILLNSTTQIQQADKEVTINTELNVPQDIDISKFILYSYQLLAQFSYVYICYYKLREAHAACVSPSIYNDSLTLYALCMPMH